MKNEVPKLSELPGDIYEFAKDEWSRRTYFGKLLYPIWFFKWLIKMLILGLVIAMLYVGAAVAFPSEKPNPILVGCRNFISNFAPEVYKD